MSFAPSTSAVSRCAARTSDARRRTRSAKTHRARATANEAEVPEDVRPHWAACRAFLRTALALTDDEADVAIARAYAWRGQTYWRNAKDKETPNVDDLRARVDFLNSVGVDAEGASEVAKKQPEILGCDVEQLTSAVEHIEKNYFMKRNTKNFKAYIKRVPQALGNNLDCAAEGLNCAGLCNRCWARC
ncbi:Mitochodrial transcription termination factor-related [Ostreococcus tauri]|uniref:Mitochodrial transcription termination factor-related n=1 Tax=Ostreococcus tauri TaxID=70448 RepID=Q00YD8_OSTTA|nr:Mitochodrial transcription termination factor-related [Ostreococcus tauri]CAL57113.1 Mitochodrial transcription termination factor-related [Ostreococcus tauri]|eukprot:XP_003082167.1 Mitochodrial transcription termination factor-related [Ostreococcus tauri]